MRLNTLDNDGYRPNVGMVIFNGHGQVLWARRVKQNTWQFPQGGIKDDESEEEAMYRELYEELGLTCHDVYIAQTSRNYHRYRVPKRMLNEYRDRNYQGQKQRWFLLGLNDDERLDSAVKFNNCKHPEFDRWRWVSYWYPLRNVITFKQDVYRKILVEFAPTVLRLDLPRHDAAWAAWDYVVK